MIDQENTQKENLLRIFSKCGIDPNNIVEGDGEKMKQWSEKILLTFFEKIVPEYKSSGILDNSTKVEAVSVNNKRGVTPFIISEVIQYYL